jgi:hypothetical protein
MAVWRDGAVPADYGRVDNDRALTKCLQAGQNQQQTEPLAVDKGQLADGLPA